MSDDRNTYRWTASAIRARSHRLGWGPQELAAELRRAAKPDLIRKLPLRTSVERTIRMHLAGTTHPRALYAELYRRAFEANGVLDLPDMKAADEHESGDEGLLRRTFLKTGVVTLPTAHAGRILQALEATGGAHLGALIASLDELLHDYAITICTQPPAETYDELLTIRAHVGGILARSGTTTHRRDLIAANGWLSNLLAIAACDMGERTAARLWCAEAERHGSEINHPELRAWAMLTRSMIAFYRDHSRQSLDLASKGAARAPRGTVIHAKLASQEMRAAALLGDGAHMRSARRTAAEAIAILPANATTTGAFSIALGEDPPYTATSLLLLGDYKEAVTATGRVIQTVYQPEVHDRGEHPSGYARSLLILGLAQAGAGDLESAAAAGHTALSAPRPAWPTMSLAKKLDRTLLSRHPDAAATSHYHDRYLEAVDCAALQRLQLLPESSGSGT